MHAHQVLSETSVADPAKCTRPAASCFFKKSFWATGKHDETTRANSKRCSFFALLQSEVGVIAMQAANSLDVGCDGVRHELSRDVLEITTWTRGLMSRWPLW